MRDNLDIAKSMVPNGFGDFSPETPVSVVSGVQPKNGRFRLVHRKLLAFYAFPQKLPDGGGFFDPTVDRPPPKPPVDPPAFEPFDFAVIRFQWSEANGRDLDTRTALSSPEISEAVGWSRASSVLFGALEWGGDNVKAGEESVLIDFVSLAAQYPTAETLAISLRAFWYAVREDGNINVRFDTYIGGAMVQDGFSFINVGGDNVDALDFGTNVFTTISEDVDGELLGHLVYNVADKTASLIQV